MLMIFRGGKMEFTEGGVRVDALVRWSGMIGLRFVCARIAPELRSPPLRAAAPEMTLPWSKHRRLARAVTLIRT